MSTFFKAFNINLMFCLPKSKKRRLDPLNLLKLSHKICTVL